MTDAYINVAEAHSLTGWGTVTVHMVMTCYSVGNKTSFTTSRTTCPCLVRTLTTRTVPSLPGSYFTTLPNHHCGTVPVSMIFTIWTIMISILLVFHRLRSCSWWRYSRNHCFPNDWKHWCSYFQRWRSSTSCDYILYSGTVNNNWPTRKWLGVRHSRSYYGSEDIGTSDLKFTWHQLYTILEGMVNGIWLWRMHCDRIINSKL